MPDDLVWYVSAFILLSTGRMVMPSGSEAGISLTEIAAYMDIHGITRPDEKMEFVKYIRDMDHAYLTERAKKLSNG